MSLKPLHKSNVLKVGCARDVPDWSQSLLHHIPGTGALPEAVPARAELGARDNPHRQGQSPRVLCSSPDGILHLLPMSWEWVGWDIPSPTWPGGACSCDRAPGDRGRDIGGVRGQQTSPNTGKKGFSLGLSERCCSQGDFSSSLLTCACQVSAPLLHPQHPHPSLHLHPSPIHHPSIPPTAGSETRGWAQTALSPPRALRRCHRGTNPLAGAPESRTPCPGAAPALGAGAELPFVVLGPR